MKNCLQNKDSFINNSQNSHNLWTTPDDSTTACTDSACIFRVVTRAAVLCFLQKNGDVCLKIVCVWFVSVFVCFFDKFVFVRFLLTLNKYSCVIISWGWSRHSIRFYTSLQDFLSMYVVYIIINYEAVFVYKEYFIILGARASMGVQNR